MFRKTLHPLVQYYDIKPLLSRCGELLPWLAYWGAEDWASPERAFTAGSTKLRAGVSIRLLTRDAASLVTLDKAVDTLIYASPAIKRRIIAVCISCVALDKQVTVEEAELMRAIAVPHTASHCRLGLASPPRLCLKGST